MPDKKKFLCPGCDTELEMSDGKRPDKCTNCGIDFGKAESLFKLLTVGAKLSRPKKKEDETLVDWLLE